MGKKIIPFLTYGKNTITEFLQQGVLYEASGADELYISSDSREDAGREEFLKAVGELTKQVDIPIIISYYVERFEDVKKALYTGASGVAVKSRDLVRAYRGEEEGSSNAGIKVLQEAISRFGSEKIYLEITDRKDREAIAARARELGIQRLVLETVEEALHLEEYFQEKEMVLLIKGSLTKDSIAKVLQKENVEGVITDAYQDKDLYPAKKALKDLGLPVNTYESSIPFAEMKKNSDGLLPVVVQDYKTREVLMVAYMNEEAYNLTVETGRMTYYSRSRSKLWLKGETSGHFQYVKSLTLDCDRDTLLAKVRQIGAACHTGSLSCFFEETVKKPYDDTNPLTVLDEVYDVIMDRKEHPKEGSYTNYLFDKGIDKILKKCGEEAAEIIIAAKNPDSSELKYEISDFLYHMMVLMAECGLDWKDILKELAHRR